MSLDLLLARFSASSGRAAVAVDEADSFASQWSYVTTASRFNVVVCSRRAGKTEGAVRRVSRLMLQTPGARVLYLTLIRRNARKLFFEPIQIYLRGRGATFTPNESDCTLRLMNGSYLECGSCLDLDDVAKHRGDKWDLVILDEAQSFRDDVIRPLIDEVILTSLGDRRGSLDLLGTPAPAGPVGYFYDVFSAGKFSRFRWTLFDNPHFPRDEVETLCNARGLTPTHPIYQREFLGEFIVDVDSLVYEYQVGRNDLPDVLPESDLWRYSMGLDLGFSDRDAIVVLGWRRDDPTHRLYERWSWQQNHLDVDQLSAIFVEAYRKWKPQIVTGDTGGHGAIKVLKSLEARLGGSTITPKPASLLDSIALVNDDLRTGRLLVNPHGDLAHDYKMVTWSPGKIKQEVSDAYHSDLTDAARYAHAGARHFAGKAPPKEKTLDELRRERSTRRRMIETDPFNPRYWSNNGR